MMPDAPHVQRSQKAVHIERYSALAAALLQRHTPWVGRVHSRYARILNIQMPDGQLLTVHDAGLLQAPCAASLADNEHLERCARHLAPGDLVAQTYQAPAALCLLAGDAVLWDGRLVPHPNLTAAHFQDTAAKLARWLVQHAREQGLTLVLAALNGESVPSPLHRRLCQAFAPVLAARHVSADMIGNLAAQVIGLGEGLTPSGDDLLVGFWAVLHHTGYAPTLLPTHAQLAPLMAHTTDLSAAFLRSALDGHFSEPMVRLMQGLYSVAASDWQARAADLARVGHSSGVGAMVGMVLANRCLYLASASPTQRH